MAVDGDVHVLHALNVLLQVADQVTHLLGRGVAHGVGDVQSGGTGGHGVGIALGQEGAVRTGGVLRGELDVLAEALGVNTTPYYPPTPSKDNDSIKEDSDDDFEY